jgi:PAS domain S-box-containing protein
MTRPLRLLIIEDSPADADLLVLSLSRAGFSPDWHRAESADELRQALAGRPWEIVLSDFSLPGFNAIQALEIVRRSAPDLSFVVVSGTIGEEQAVAIMRAGANDYLLKDNLIRLPAVVERELRDTQARLAHRQAEFAARHLAAIVQSSEDAIIGESLDGLITAWNPAAERLFGWAGHEALGRPDLGLLVPPDRVEELLQFIGLVRTGLRAPTLETVRLHKDGSRIDVAVTLSPVFGSSGDLIGLSKIVRDIRKQRRDAQALAFDALILANVRDSVVVTDMEGTVTYWNEGASRLFGWTAEEMLGRPMVSRFPEHARDEAQAIIRRIGEGVEFHGEFQDYMKDGSRVWIDACVTALAGPDGSPIGLLGISHDISARKKAEQDLRLRDRAIQAVTQGIVISDATAPDYPIIYASPGFERITGYGQQEVVGRNCRILQGKDTDAEVVARMRRALRQGGTFTGEVLNYRKDGTPFWNELSISPVHDEGRLSHYVGVLLDVTQRRQLEEQYRHSQKMEAVGQLAGGIAHDFNNHLTVITGYSDLLMKMLPEESGALPLVQEVHRASQRSTALTRQLLLFSRRQMAQPRVLDVNAVVTDAEKMLRRLIGEHIEFVTVLRPLVGRVRADPGQLEQVLLNLVVNARDAMQQGGRITIRTEDVELDEVYARLHVEARPGGYVMLAVTDTGVGMTADVKARIFEPFFTTKAPGKGTGLGLAVVHGIVQKAGGHIGVYTEVSLGTTFKVYLPRVQVSHQGVGPRPEPQLPPRGSETVLLVEDDDSVRALSLHVLRGCGYAVLEAENGLKALEVAAGHAGPIHLLITDVVMPVMGGRELAERLLALRKETKALFVSGYADDAVFRHGIEEEMVQFLVKPFSPHGLAQKAREVLDGQ